MSATLRTARQKLRLQLQHGPESTIRAAPLERPLFWLSKSINNNNIFHETEYFTLRDTKTFPKLVEIPLLATSCSRFSDCWQKQLYATRASNT